MVYTLYDIYTLKYMPLLRLTQISAKGAIRALGVQKIAVGLYALYAVFTHQSLALFENATKNNLTYWNNINILV